MSTSLSNQEYGNEIIISILQCWIGSGLILRLKEKEKKGCRLVVNLRNDLAADI